MFRNYLKTAWRNLMKNKFYSLLNIGGLSIGIAFTFLVVAFVWSQYQVNHNLQDLDRQYIVQSKWKDPNMGFEIATFGNVVKDLKLQYPNLVDNYYRWDGITTTVSKGANHFKEDVQINDSTFFSMYGFPVLYGDTKTAFNDPFSAVVTESIAKKYFGKIDVVGQTISIENMSGEKHDFLITAVLKEMPVNSVTKINDWNINKILLAETSANFFNRKMDAWDNPSILSYVKLKKGISPKDLEIPLKSLIEKNTNADIARNLRLYLVPLKTYYLEVNNGVVKKTMYTLSFISFFILFMAIVNFVNVAVAGASSRMREIGVRKVFGGVKRQLILQFLLESTLLVLFSTVFGFIIYIVTKDFFGNIVGSEMPSLSSFPTYFITFPFLMILTIGILAGIYPAFILSGMKAVDSLKGKLKTVKEKVLLRKSLIAFQFVIAAIVFIGAIIISQQINLFFSKGLGYNKDYIISAQLPRDWSAKGVRHMETLRNEFAKMSQISGVTLSYEIPNGNNSTMVPIYKLNNDSINSLTSIVLQTDENYLSVFKIPLLVGKPFEGNVSDSGTLILNHTAITALGFNSDNDAINQRIRIPGDPTIFTIRGVTNDFHFGSMQQKVSPMVMINVNYTFAYRFLSFKIKPSNITSSIADLQKKWSELMPDAPFEFRFMDDYLKDVYNNELRLKRAAYTATVLAFVIVLIGVISLISLSIQKRTKEIGIRKVLGASGKSIITLFIKDFVVVIIVAIIIAFPFAYFLMSHWLQGYAYKIHITWMPFATAFILLLVITFILIIIQTFKAANANPVKSLRTE